MNTNSMYCADTKNCSCEMCNECCGNANVSGCGNPMYNVFSWNSQRKCCYRPELCAIDILHYYLTKGEAAEIYVNNRELLDFLKEVKNVYETKEHVFEILQDLLDKIDSVVESYEWDAIKNKPSFATVATSGDYSDLNNKPEFKTINGEPILGNGDVEVVVDVDDHLDVNSENPVQNKVVTAEMETIKGGSNKSIEALDAQDEALGQRVDSLESAVGTGGSVDTRIQSAVSAEAAARQEGDGQLLALYEALTQSDIVVVADHTEVSSPVANTIYRELGDTSYSDWMYYDENWYKIAEYDNAIDDAPTAGGNGFVIGDGIYKALTKIAGVKVATHPLKSSAVTTVREMPIINGKKYSVYLKSDQNTGCYIRFGLGSSESGYNKTMAVSPEDLLSGVLVSLVSTKNGARIYTSTTNANNDDSLSDYSNVNTNATVYWNIFEEGNEFLDSEITKNSEVCKHTAPKLYIPSLFANSIKFTGNTSFSLTNPSFDLRHFGDNGKYAKSFTNLYSTLKSVIQASTSGGAKIVSYDDSTSTMEIRMGGSANKLCCLYNASTETIRFTIDTYSVEDHEVLLWSITGYADSLAFYVLGADVLTEKYNAFRHGNGYKIEKLYYTSSLINMPALFDFPVYQDHIYEIYLHSLETVDIEISLGLGSNGDIGSWTAAELNAGKTITKRATTTIRSRIYVNTITGTNKNVLLYISIKDVTEPESLNEGKVADIDRIVTSDSLNGNIRNLGVNPNRKRLWIGEVVNAGNFFGFQSNIYAVASIDKAEAIPFNGCTFFLHMPKYLRCDILHCVANRNMEPSLTNHSGWLSDGDSFTFPVESTWFRLGFSAVYSDTGENGIISPAFITSLIMNGELYIEYDDSGSVIDNNKANESYIKGMMYKCPIKGTPGNNPSNTYRTIGELPVISHVSDIHGDITRLKNFLDYSEYLKVDAAILSGDFVAYRAASGIDFLDRMCKRYSMPQFFCVGNHEKHGFTEAQVRSNIITPFASRNDYTIGSGVNYYYKDLADKKLRIIVLNQYDLDDIEWVYAHISSTLMNWFISTLASTPAEYGVVLVSHSWEYYKMRYDEGYTAFMDEVHKGGAMEPIAGAPITNIIDAFISKTTVSGTYTQTVNNSGETETISYSADFRNVASGVEFIMWCNGHEHRDHIGYISNTNNLILNCNIACGIATYEYGDNNGLASCCDMPRGGMGSTQDCINIYAIDRGSKTVRVARVGANINRNMEDRKWMIIPYSNTSYITDGLIFQLDGINKGSDSNSWTDLISGLKFPYESNATKGTNYVEFNGTGSLQATSNISMPQDDCTIEIVCDPVQNSKILFYPSAVGHIMFGFSGSEELLLNYGTSSAPRYIISPSSESSTAKYFSVSPSKCVVDMQECDSTTNDNWGAQIDGKIKIGGRNTDYMYSGKIYAIRVYNRALSMDEIRQNHNVDVHRFGI